MKKIHTQIITLLVIAILVPIIIVAGVSSFELNKNLKQDFNDIATASIGKITQSIETLNKQSNDTINMLSQDPNAKEMLAHPEYQVWLNKSLQVFADNHKDISSAYLGMSNKKMILEPAQTLPADYDPTSRSWYTLATENKDKVVLTPPYKDAAGDNGYVVTFAKTVSDTTNTNLVGVMAIDIKLIDLSGNVASTTLGKSGYVIVFDSDGNVIAAKDKTLLGKGEKNLTWIKDVLAVKSPGEIVKINGKSYLSYVAKDKSTGWQIAGIIPQSEITSKVNAIYGIILLISAIAVAASIFAGIVLSKGITNPINGLIQVLKRLEVGDFSQKAEQDKSSCYEINQISKHLNQMIEEVSGVLVSVIDTSKSIKEASSTLLTISEQSSSAGDEVAKAIQEIAQGATEQAQSLDEGTEEANKLGEEVNASMSDAERMNKASIAVKNNTTDGIVIINNLMETFRDTAKANEMLVKEVEILADNTNKVGVITDTIRGITEQTNLLALNASIEAARAGDAGKGFAVVAEEVRKLAEQSSESANEINKVVTEINTSVISVSKTIKRSKELGDKTTESVKSTSAGFEKIEKATGVLEDSIERLNKSLQLINSNKDMVIKKIDAIADVSQGTAATSEEVSAASEQEAAGLQQVVASAEELSRTSNNLDIIASKFKI